MITRWGLLQFSTSGKLREQGAGNNYTLHYSGIKQNERAQKGVWIVVKEEINATVI